MYWFVRVLLPSATVAAILAVAGAFRAVGPDEEVGWAVLAAASRC